MENKQDICAAVYLRRFGFSEEDLAKRKTYILSKANDRHYRVVNVFCDDSLPRKNRKALKMLLREMKHLQTKIVIVEEITQISHNDRTLYWFLKKLQNIHGKMECLQEDLSYEMYLNGIGDRLKKRAMRKNLMLPW